MGEKFKIGLRTYIAFGDQKPFREKVSEASHFQKLFIRVAFYHSYHIHQRSSEVSFRVFRVFRGQKNLMENLG